MTTPLLDLSYLEEISGKDQNYIQQVLKIYLDAVPEGLAKLEELLKTDDYPAIQKQAHFLKSSASIVKVKDMFDNLKEIDMLARQETGKDEMVERMASIRTHFAQALPLILAERDKAESAVE